LNRFGVFILRLLLGAGFGIILMRIFFPNAHAGFGIGLAAALVALAYVFEYFKNRNAG
jgi:hypothetical protein